MDNQLIKPVLKSPDLEPKLFYRFNFKGKRYYSEVNKVTENIKFYPSVTTIIGKVVPTSPFIEMMMKEKGKDFNAWFNEYGHKGTFVHNEINNYLLTHLFDMDTLDERVYQYLVANKYTYNVDDWVYELRPKLTAMLKFIKDYNLTPLLCEGVVKFESDEFRLASGVDFWGFAGAVDFLGYADIPEEVEVGTGEYFKSGPRAGTEKTEKQIIKKRKLCLIDWKSGNNSDYKNYTFQQHMYAMAIEQTYGLQVEEVITVNPKEFKDGNVPNYNVTNHKEKFNLELLLSYINIYFWDHHVEPTKVQDWSGQLNGEDTIDSIFRYKTALEYAKEKFEKTKEALV